MPGGRLYTPSRVELHTDGHSAPRPHDNCYWLAPSGLLAGEYPGTADVHSSRPRLRAILESGVRHFVDLTEAREPLARYEQIAQEQAALLGASVGYERHPIRDLGVPDAATMRSILATLRTPRDGATYLHCWGGIGRTGTVVGCLLVELGFSGEEALALIARKWASMEKRSRCPHSPETEEQRAFILQWRASS